MTAFQISSSSSFFLKGFMLGLEQIPKPLWRFARRWLLELQVMTGDGFLWETPPQLFSHVFSHRPLCFNMNASVRKSGLRAGKKKNMTVCRASQKEVLRNVCFADAQRAFRRLHYLTSQVKLDYGSCSVSYIRRWKILQLQRLKSPDGTKHAFVKIHLHYTDFIFPPSSQSHSALAF